MIRTSLRGRLLASVAAIQIIGAAVATYLVVDHERRQSYVAFDAKLGETTAVVRSLVEAPDEAGASFILHREFLSLPSDVRYFIADSKGRLIGQSPGWTAPKSLPSGPRAFITVPSGTVVYRALVLQNLPAVDAESPGAVPPTLTLICEAPITPVEAQIHRVELQALAACVALLALSTMISAGAIRRGLRPLRELAVSAGGIKVGQWSVAEIEQSRGVVELAPLASALVSLVERLRAAFEREQQFVGDAAHEMKTAIAIVRSTLQVALQTDRTAAQYRGELEAALGDTNRLAALVRSMLNLARIETPDRGQPVAETARTEVHAQARLIKDRFHSLAEDRGVLIVLEEASGEVWVRMTEDDLVTVLSNLVENAIQYSSPGQHVTVRIESRGGACLLRVIDQGCGIPEAALPHIFDRFFRGDASRARTTGGIGLGLAIVKALVGNAGGLVSVESVEGEGSVFLVELPSR